MRLTCPECGAQYEVPKDVIPEGGRDVQCSNCAHTWFQSHPDDPAPDAEALATPPSDSQPDTGDDLPPPPRAAAEPPEQRRARRIDPQVEEVLRQEREFENRRRAAEAGIVESQPDLGLHTPDNAVRARQARADLAARESAATPQPRPEDIAPEVPRDAAPPIQPPEPSPRRAEPEDRAGETEDWSVPVPPPAPAPSRRELLPDVEEISQSLTDSHKPRAVDEAERHEVGDTETKEKSGFGKGFFLVLVIAGLLTAVYASAPQIAESVPALAPVLSAFVETVDAARAWLDAQVAVLLSTLDGMSSEATEAGS
ncbi:zinc-ribbon domain-containing protein [Cognatishimia sp. F0-27]|uniref:zinc-ribbon domain-containing protein n=1 Tax=Cognatishimia sp. F0-27 TaxID=2816855 RepID=UPI001D0C7DD6|nr:zinc-ribbon domain-containing protein [Cognatishimia sp. F0-27]MCC1491966.1 zinc-ribbon domain-containing protein [Cognatishimia sp. F0-27]